MDLDVIESAGIPKKESEVYLLLLKNGPSKGAELAKKMNISRPHIYDALNSLARHGLVGHSIKNGTRIYSAASPEKLLDFVHTKKEDLIQNERLLMEALPGLISKQKNSSPHIRVEVFEGKEGARTVFNDVNRQTLLTKKEMVLFGAASGLFRKLDPIFHQKHYKERERYGIHARYIFNEGADIIRHPLIKYRVLPAKFKVPSVTWIFGNKVSIWMLSDAQWLCCVIENESLADSYREYFEFIWKTAKIIK
ncbi:MAG: hypothetical protein NTY48_02985 [Candidatus Diapherotrites archaeon]|nr:hypothetical protein [Candidatus Diapherotrites archaeon]